MAASKIAISDICRALSPEISPNADSPAIRSTSPFVDNASAIVTEDAVLRGLIRRTSPPTDNELDACTASPTDMDPPHLIELATETDALTVMSPSA